MNYIIVDFEMNPIAKEYIAEKQICRSEIIEIGAVIMDENYMDNNTDGSECSGICYCL